MTCIRRSRVTTLDILWNDNWYLTLPSAAGEHQAYLDALSLSNNNDISLEIYQSGPAISFPSWNFNFADAEAVKNISLFADNMVPIDLSG